YNRPDATTRSLRDGFFSVGDVAYRDAEGYFYICDRRIDMVISGGVNIYPAEVEAVLHAHPAVMDAAVIGIPDEEWGESVKAVVRRGETRVLLERVPASIVAPSKRLGDPRHLRPTLAERTVQAARHRLPVFERALPDLAGQVEVDVIEMHVLDAPCGELDNLDRVCARDHEMSDVEANARLRADEQALDLLRP